MGRSNLLARIGATARVLAALLGSLSLAVLVSVALARFLPLTGDVRVVIGFTAATPIWVATMCSIFLARSGMRAWVSCVALGVAFGLLDYGVPG